MRTARTTRAVVGILALALAFGAPAAQAGGKHRGRHHTETVRYGPFTIPGATANGPGMLENTIVREGGCVSLPLPCLDRPMPKPCEQCYVTSIVPNLVDAATGETLNFENGAMLHHVVNLNWSRPDATCPPGDGPGLINWLGRFEGGNDRFFAAGNERTITRFPRGYGLPVRRGDEWGLIFHLMNMTAEPRDVALEYAFTWTKKRLRPLTSLWLDVDNCSDSEIDVPVGYSDVHWDWRSTIAGQVVAIGGHVHDNGISISAANVSRGKVICSSRAGYARGSIFAPAGPGSGADPLHPRWWRPMPRSDHPSVSLESYKGHIAGMTGCRRRSHLSAGDTIRLHAQYNVGEPDRGKHVMGIMVGYVHERR